MEHEFHKVRYSVYFRHGGAILGILHLCVSRCSFPWSISDLCSNTMGYKVSLDSKMENAAFMHLKFSSNFVFFKLAYITNKREE